MTTEVGFIGLGNIGLPMAKRLAGFGSFGVKGGLPACHKEDTAIYAGGFVLGQVDDKLKVVGSPGYT